MAPLPSCRPWRTTAAPLPPFPSLSGRLAAMLVLLAGARQAHSTLARVRRASLRACGGGDHALPGRGIVDPARKRYVPSSLSSLKSRRICPSPSLSQIWRHMHRGGQIRCHGHQLGGGGGQICQRSSPSLLCSHIWCPRARSDGKCPDSGGLARMLAPASSGSPWMGSLGLSTGFFFFFFFILFIVADI